MSRLYSAAGRYGAYADCFVDGALQAFSTYAQEVEAARWLGIASAFVDLSDLAKNKDWLGNRQLAAMAAFNYRTPGPIFEYGKGDYRFIAVNKKKLGVASDGRIIMFGLKVYRERDNLLSSGVVNPFLGWERFVDVKSGRYGDVGYSLKIARFKYYEGGEKSGLAAVVFSEDGKILLTSYNDYVLALTIGKKLVGGVLGEPVAVRLGGLEGWARGFTYKFPGDVADVACSGGNCYWETFLKYLTGALAPEIYGTRPEAVGLEVDMIRELRPVRLSSGIITDIQPGSRGLFAVQASGTAFDLLAVDKSGRLVIAEVKRVDYYSESGYLDSVRASNIPGKVGMLLKLRDVVKGYPVSEGELVSYLVAAYNGAGAVGTTSVGVSSTFVYRPVLQRVDWRGERTPVVFSLVLVDASSGKAVVFAVETELGRLTPDFVEAVARDAYRYFRTFEVTGGRDLKSVVDSVAEQYQGTPPFLK